jgi:hypothetical protein
LGDFSLSNAAAARLKELGHPMAIEEYKEDPKDFSFQINTQLGMIPRNDPFLVQVVEELGSEVASGQFARLSIKEIDPTDDHWYVHDYDGKESIEYGVYRDHGVYLL